MRPRTKPVTTRFTEEDCAALARIAAREDRTVGYVIRRFVREGLKRAERKGEGRK